MFELCNANIEIDALRERLLHDASGAYVSFEGWVRNHHNGEHVTHLHYESYAPLAVAEGQTIIHEAQERFAIRSALCQHRTGELSIGGIAVWVGVTADHRDAAFASCRYIIDEVKLRVPIWKKEFFPDRDAIWVDPRP